jgi:protein-S-isoprenylcysteine O-methyltransferase Ste14
VKNFTGIFQGTRGVRPGLTLSHRPATPTNAPRRERATVFAFGAAADPRPRGGRPSLIGLHGAAVVGVAPLLTARRLCRMGILGTPCVVSRSPAGRCDGINPAHRQAARAAGGLVTRMRPGRHALASSRIPFLECATLLDRRRPAAGRSTVAPGEDGRSDWSEEGAAVNIRALVGSGDRIGLVTLPFLVVGVALNIAFPSPFTVGGPPTWLGVLSVLVLLVGVVNWAWCVYLLLIKVPRRELVTNGPYAVVKHPLYTGAALLVLPWLGFLLNTWLGAAIGIVLYVASRMFAPAEEVELAQTFGGVWDAYTAEVKLPWL